MSTPRTTFKQNRSISTVLLSLKQCLIASICTVLLFTGNRLHAQNHQWSFNQCEGTSVTDGSNLPKQLNLTGAQWVAGRNGQALSFDGQDDEARVDESTFTPWEGAFTIAFWTKTADSNQRKNSSIFSSSNSSKVKNSFQIELDGNGNYQLLYASDKGSSKTIPLGTASNNWQHIVITSDGQTTKAYFGGALVGSTTEMTFGKFDTYKLGINRGNSVHYRGFIDELSIQNSALSETEIASLAATPAAPENCIPDEITATHHWDFNTCQGTIATDVATTQNPTQDLSLTGTEWVEGYHGQALYFDGNDAVAQTTIETKETMFTLSLWIKAASLNQKANSSVFASSNNSKLKGSFQIDVDGTNNYRLLFTSPSGATTSFLLGTITTDWTHLAILADGQGIYGYYNGALTGSSEAMGTATFETYKVGVNRGNSTYFQGTIDEVEVYPYPIGDVAIANIANQIATPENCTPDDPMVLHNWSLDACEGTIAADAGNGAQALTITNAEWVEGYVNQALHFDGKDDEARAAITTWEGQFTLSLWVKAASLNQRNHSSIFASSNDPNIKNSFQIDIDGSNRYRVYYRNVNGKTESLILGSAPAQEWVHLSVVADGQSFKGYYNGNLAGTKTDASVGYFETYKLGVNRNNNKHFEGTIDEISIYPYALAATNIEQKANVQAAPKDCLPEEIAPIHEWAFNACEGEEALDTQAITNLNLSKTQRVAGYVNQGLYFDGIESEARNEEITPWEGQFTVALWTKTTEVTQHRNSTLFSTSNDPNVAKSFQIEIDGQRNYLLNYRSNKGASQSIVIGSVTEDWNHIAVSANGKGVKVYYNGIEVGNANDLSIGRFEAYKLGINRNNNKRFQGTLDEVKVYPYAIGAENIQSLATVAENSQDCVPAVQSPSNLWSFSACEGELGADNGAQPMAFSLTGATVSEGYQGQGIAFVNNGDEARAEIEAWQGQFTVALWAKAASTNQKQFSALFSTANSPNVKRSFQIDQDGKGNYRLLYADARGARGELTLGVVTEDWTHLAVSGNGQELKVYYNGELVGTANDLGVARFEAYKLGVNRNNSTYYKGNLDEVHVFRYAATDENIQALANASFNPDDCSPRLVADITYNDCDDASAASIILTPYAGAEPYSVAWSDGSTAFERNDLATGEYQVTVTGGNEETKTYTYFIGRKVLWQTAADVNYDEATQALSHVGVPTFSQSGATSENALFPEEEGNISWVVNSFSTEYITGFTTQEEVISDTSQIVYGFYQLNNGLFIKTPEALYYYGQPKLGDRLSVQRTAASIQFFVGGQSVLLEEISIENNWYIGSAVTKGTVPAVSTSFCTAINTIASLDLTSCDTGENTGSISVEASGGVAPYQFQWADIVNPSNTRENLSKGRYGLTITDATGKKAYYTYTIGNEVIWEDVVGSQVSINNQLEKITPSNGWGSAGAGSQNILSSGLNGSIEWIVENLATTYAIGLSQENTDASYSSIDYGFLVENNYAYLVQNGNKTEEGYKLHQGTILRIERVGDKINWKVGVQAIAELAIDDQIQLLVDAAILEGILPKVSASFCTPLLLTAEVTEQDCSEENLGAITVQAIGGSGDYTYYWPHDNGSGISRTNLTAGEYQVQVTDNSTGASKTYTYLVGRTTNWTDQVGITINAEGDLQKTATEEVWGYAGAFSENVLESNQDGKISWIYEGGESAIYVAGLSQFNIDAHFDRISHGILVKNGNAAIYQNAIPQSSFVKLYEGDVLSIVKEGDKIRYYRNLELLGETQGILQQSLQADIAIREGGITNLMINFCGSVIDTTQYASWSPYGTFSNEGNNFKTSAESSFTAHADYNGVTNSVLTYVALQRGLSEAQITGPNETLSQMTVQYTDGIGRPIQTVTRAAAPDKSDLVQVFAYDEIGRQVESFLPFNKMNSSNASFTTTAGQELSAFYNNAVGFARTTHPFSKTLLENSPLNRAKKQAAPGEDWVGAMTDNPNQINPGVVSMSYRSNTISDQVILWDASKEDDNIVKKSAYGEAQLIVVETIDENGFKNLEFTNRKGQVVLKKVEEKVGQYLSTYYVYDDFGNLRFVFPPKLSNMLVLLPTGDVNLKGIEQGLMFEYRYDERQRMEYKKVPGASKVEMFYDLRDRLVMTKDGNENQIITKYDHLNRPVITSLYEGNVGSEVTTVNKAKLSSGPLEVKYAVVDEHDTNVTVYQATDKITFLPGFEVSASTTGDVTIAELKNTTSTSGYVLGYLDDNAPILDADDLLTVTYYDDYDFNGDGVINPEDVAPLEGTVNTEGAGPLPIPQGQVTASKVRVLEKSQEVTVNESEERPTQWLTTATYYDDKYRVIETRADNHIGGRDIVKNEYDFMGNMTKSTITHENPSVRDATDNIEVTHVVNTYTFRDHDKRLIDVSQSIDGAAAISLAKNEYNDLGQLLEKSIGKTAAQTSYQQVCNYLYNERGWMTQMNDPNNLGGDYFAMQLFYQNPLTIGGGLTASGNKVERNGNISAIQWKTSTKSERTRAYGYQYDGLNRLKQAEYMYKEGNQWTYASRNTSTGAILNDNRDEKFTTYNLWYDLNGNIERLNREGLRSWGTETTNPSYDLIDQLTYVYISDNGNQLRLVNDAISNNLTQANTNDFTNGTNILNDYSYDANGNLTQDQNKEITQANGIVYNHLNLPIIIYFGGGTDKYIEYTYDAAGIKLKKDVYESGKRIKTVNYVGGFVYESNQFEENGTVVEAQEVGPLQFMHTQEGRAMPPSALGDPNQYQYEFHLKDHLGNLRLSFQEGKQWLMTAEDTDEQRARAESEFFEGLEGRRDGMHKETGGQKGAKVAMSNDGDPATFIRTKKIPVKAGEQFDLRVWVYDEGTSGIGGGQQATEAGGAFNDDNSQQPNFNLNTPILSTENILGPEGQVFGQNVQVNVLSLANLLKKKKNKNRRGARNKPVYAPIENPYNGIQLMGTNGPIQLEVKVYSADGMMVYHSHTCGVEFKDGQEQIITINDFTIPASVPADAYMQVSIKNKEEAPVWFDNLQITAKDAILQENHYYAFGMNMTGIEKQGSPDHKFQFNQGTGDDAFKTEREQDFGLNWDLTKHRAYDYQLGRFHQVDPLADQAGQESWTSYHYGFNNPILYNDPMGMMPNNGDPNPGAEFVQQVKDGFKAFKEQSYSFFKGLLGMKGAVEHSKQVVTSKSAKAETKGKFSIERTIEISSDEKIEVKVDLSEAVDLLAGPQDSEKYDGIFSIERSSSIATAEKTKISSGPNSVEISNSKNNKGEVSSSVEFANGVSSDIFELKRFAQFEKKTQNGKTTKSVQAGASIEVAYPVNKTTTVKSGLKAAIIFEK